MFPRILGWGALVKTGASTCRKVGSTHFFSYFKRRVGRTNNYLGLPHNQSYTQKNIGYVSPYPRLGEHLLKRAYLRVGRLDRLIFFPPSRGELAKQIISLGHVSTLLPTRATRKRILIMFPLILGWGSTC